MCKLLTGACMAAAELKLIYLSIILMCSETSINEEITSSLVKSVIFGAKDKRKETTADIKEIND